MGNVVPFRRPDAEAKVKPRQMVWKCGECDKTDRWVLREDGRIECGECGHMNATMGWFFFEPDGAA